MKQYTVKQLAKMLSVRIKRNEQYTAKQNEIDNAYSSYTHNKVTRNGVAYWGTSKIKPSAEKRIATLDNKIKITTQEIESLTVKIATTCTTYTEACEVFNGAVMDALEYGEGWELEETLEEAFYHDLLTEEQLSEILAK